MIRDTQQSISHPLEALRRWEHGHHLFFVLIQSLIVIHDRLERALRNQNWKLADEALANATEVLWACSAAFHFTGDFTSEVFNEIVRVSMEPPHERAGFSGLHSADHTILLKNMKQLGALLERLPQDLKRRHRAYLWAIDAMYESHAMVCDILVGNRPSLKMEASENEASAPEMIRNLKTRTLKLAGNPSPILTRTQRPSMFTIRIDDSVFKQQPTFRRGIVIATGMQNQGANLDLEQMLRIACLDAAASPVSLWAHPHFAVWADAFRSLGVDPKKFAPAHLALRKRLQQSGGASLPFINKAVAVMNLSSIEGMLPVGGDDLTAVAEHAHLLELKCATGDEAFVPLGGSDEQHPEPGEVILAAGGLVCCRRWCWRNGHLSRVTDNTTLLAMNVDGLGPDSETRAVTIRDRVAALLREYCQANTTTALLSPESPEFQFAL